MPNSVATPHRKTARQRVFPWPPSHAAKHGHARARPENLGLIVTSNESRWRAAQECAHAKVQTRVTSEDLGGWSGPRGLKLTKSCGRALHTSSAKGQPTRTKLCAARKKIVASPCW